MRKKFKNLFSFFFRDFLNFEVFDIQMVLKTSKQTYLSETKISRLRLSIISYCKPARSPY